MLGARIAALRRQNGMNQAQLAEVLQISPSAVGMYEQGRREPSAQMLVEMAKIFHVSLDYLMTGCPTQADVEPLNQLLAERLQAADQRLEARKDRPFSREELAALFAALLLEL